jgi:excisionase family DNA binding protein
MDSERLTLNIEEVAKLLGLGRTTTYELARAGRIPSMRLGRRLLVPRAALVRFLDAQSSGTGNQNG